MSKNPRRLKADLYNPNCASREVLELIGGKWSMLIVCVLHDRTSRTGELKRTISGISQKMLTQCLRDLERNGIVHRTSYPEVPPRVEYELTELGWALAQLVVQMEQWIVENYPAIRKARERHQESEA